MRLFLAILVIGAVAVGGFTLYKHKQLVQNEAVLSQQAAQQQAPQPVPTDSGKKVPFTTFVAQANAPYQCTVHQALSDMDNTATVYIDNGNLKGDYRVVAEGKTMQGSFLMTGGYQYLWMSNSKTGYKVPVGTVSSSGSVATPSSTYTWNTDQIGDYDCQPWTATATAFAVPAGITFTDMSAMFKMPAAR